MSKYEPLERFLKAQKTDEVAMTFSEIEKVIGRPLPEKSSRHRAWWSNNPSNNVMTKAWLSAGFETERVDMGSRRLVFRRRKGSGSNLPQATVRPKGVVERIRAKLAGTVTVPPGVDLCEPAGGDWDVERQ